MGFASVCIDITDPEGNSVIGTMQDGTRPVYKIVLDRSLSASGVFSGTTYLLTLSTGGSGAFPEGLTVTGPTELDGTLLVQGPATFEGGEVVAEGINADVLSSGPLSITGGQQTTTGNSMTVICALPVNTNRVAPLAFMIGADDGTYRFSGQSLGASQWTGSGPTFSVASPWNGPATFPFPVSANVVYTSAHIELQGTGPQATITAAADNGSGKVRLTVAQTLSTWASTIAVDISGLSVCTEANGTNIPATFVDANHFDLLGVSIVHTGADSGLVVEHVGRVVTWVGSLWVLARTP